MLMKVLCFEKSFQSLYTILVGEAHDLFYFYKYSV